MEKEGNNIAKEVKKLVVDKLPDVEVHVLKFPLDKITVCVFWNDSKTFKFNIKKYQEILNEEIKPFFENI